MNAITPITIGEEFEARRARHMRNLAELGELGMALARGVARVAIAELEAAETEAPPPEQAPARTAPPGVSRSHAAAPAFSSGARADLSLAFARLSRAVAQAHALEARIAAGEIGVAPRRPGATARDLGLGVIKQVLRKAAASEPDTETRVSLFSGIQARIEAIRADAADDRPVAEIIGAICDRLSLELDPAALPEEVFHLLRAETPRQHVFAEREYSSAESGGPDPP